MEVREAIRTRRSIGKVKSDPVPREWIEDILEAGAWAPNHHNTEPWRFFVMTGEGRGVLGRAYAEIALEAAGDLSAEERQAQEAAQAGKAFRAPVVIAVAASPSTDPRVPRIEEIAAVHAAAQNMLLAAHALGLGAVWRTGAPAYHPRMKAAFGLGEAEEIAGFLYIGYPDMAAPAGKRAPVQQKTVWLE